MRLFGWSNEREVQKRAQSYTQLVINAFARALGVNSEDPNVAATAAVEFGASKYCLLYTSDAADE